MFSFFFAASTRAEAGVMLAMCAAIFLALLVGWHTRLFHILSFVCVVSLDSRGIFLENGGDVVQNLLCAWTMFLPMGERFSVDALIRRMRERREANLDELSDRAAIAAPIVKIRSLAFLCIWPSYRSFITSTRFTSTAKPGSSAAPYTSSFTKSAWSPGWGGRYATSSTPSCRASPRTLPCSSKRPPRS